MGKEKLPHGAFLHPVKRDGILFDIDRGIKKHYNTKDKNKTG